MKSVVMIGGGLQQVEAVNEARKLGFFVIVTDKNKSAPCFVNADMSVVLDGKDIKGISKFINKNKKRLNILGVFTCVNLAPTVAAVAKECTLLGIEPDVAKLSDNKFEQKEILTKHGIPTPNFSKAETYKELKEAYRKLGRKIVIKPLDSFGGQGVILVKNEIELKKTFKGIKKYSKKRQVIIEEYVEGHFVDLEGIFFQEKFYPLAIVDSYFLWENPKGNPISPIEYKNVYPASVNEAMKKKLFLLTEKSAQALGINFGPVATDMVITKKGPMVIEISARLHGSSSNLFLIPQASGIKPVTLLIKIMTGGSISKSETLPKFNKFGIYKYLLSKEGIITGISGLKEASKFPDLKKIFLFKKIGDQVRYRNSTDVPASMVVVSNTLNRAEKTIREVGSLIDFNVR